ncbi:MAG: hypothetical protein ACE5IR_26050 [bacterium]
MSEKTYTPGEVIEKVGKGLNRDNLAYFVREGYIAPKKAKRGNQVYKQYTEANLWIIDRAMTYMDRFKTRPRAAFEMAKKDYGKGELGLDI